MTKIETESHLNSIAETLLDDKIGQRWAFREARANIRAP
jgi:hypothetical protein